MKAFFEWIVLAFFIFAGSSGGYHFYLESHPNKILVILDTSYPMRQVWDRVPDLIEALEKKHHRYTLFALSSEKGRIHDLQKTIDIGRVKPYAPRNLQDLSRKLPEIANADRVYLITNAAADEIPNATGWTILHP